MKSFSCLLDKNWRAHGAAVLPILGMALLLTLAAAPHPAAGQHAEAVMAAHHPDMEKDNRVWGANFKLAARFAPYITREMAYSTNVAPRWIGDTDRFWYQWDNSNGTFYYLVDPARGSKSQIFENDEIAAQLTLITGDPFDGLQVFLQAG